MISELLDEDREALCAALSNALTDEQLAPLKKKARDLAVSVAEDIEWTLKDNLAANLAWHVRDMAGRVVETLLAGNESEMARWLSCDQRGYTGRSDGYHIRNNDIADQHRVIHGKLFEQGCIALRRGIVEAHRDLITDQRILDLEDQVRSLVAQNNKLERERNDWRERAIV